MAIKINLLVPSATNQHKSIPGKRLRNVREGDVVVHQGRPVLVHNNRVIHGTGPDATIGAIVEPVEMDWTGTSVKNWDGFSERPRTYIAPQADLRRYSAPRKVGGDKFIAAQKIQTSAKGARYYINASGNKVYVK